MGKEIWGFLLISLCAHCWYLAVLVLAGIELIFCIVACMVLFWICDDNNVDNTPLF